MALMTTAAIIAAAMAAAGGATAGASFGVQGTKPKYKDVDDDLEDVRRFDAAAGVDNSPKRTSTEGIMEESLEDRAAARQRFFDAIEKGDAIAGAYGDTNQLAQQLSLNASNQFRERNNMAAGIGTQLAKFSGSSAEQGQITGDMIAQEALNRNISLANSSRGNSIATRQQAMLANQQQSNRADQQAALLNAQQQAVDKQLELQALQRGGQLQGLAAARDQNAIGTGLGTQLNSTGLQSSFASGLANLGASAEIRNAQIESNMLNAQKQAAAAIKAQKTAIDQQRTANKWGLLGAVTSGAAAGAAGAVAGSANVDAGKVEVSGPGAANLKYPRNWYDDEDEN